MSRSGAREPHAASQITRLGRWRLALRALLLAALLFSFVPTISPARAQARQDEFAATDCDWNTGACDMLKGYRAAGVKDPTCLGVLSEAVQVERRWHALADRSPRSGHDPELDRQIADDQQEVDRLIASLPKDCLGKGLYPIPAPGGTAVPSANDLTLLNTMIRCLGERLSYYRPPTVTIDNSLVVPSDYTPWRVMYSPPLLGRKPLQTRAFLLATSLAHEVLWQHDRIYASATPDVPGGSVDAIVGFLDRCLIVKGLVPAPLNNAPDDPRILYSSFISQPTTAGGRMDYFSQGFTQWPLTPLSLLPR